MSALNLACVGERQHGNFVEKPHSYLSSNVRSVTDFKRSFTDIVAGQLSSQLGTSSEPEERAERDCKVPGMVGLNLFQMWSVTAARPRL